MQYSIICLKLDMGSNSFETVAWHEVKYCWSANKTLIQFQHWSTNNYTLYMYQVLCQWYFHYFLKTECLFYNFSVVKKLFKTLQISKFISVS